MTAGMLLAGRYELNTQLGAGGFGSVWRATDKTLLREVAVKLIELDNDLDRSAREAATIRFQREAQAVAGLNHPNVVAAYDFGIEGDTAYLVMELVRGASLLQMLKARRAAGQGPFDVPTVIRIGTEACAGLGAAHRAGLVHRDLKPANLMLAEPSGQVKIVDFGIARFSDRSKLTRTGSYMGTLPYIAPEQMSANPLDSRADIYSLGCLLHELLTGRSPYDAESPVQWLAAHQYSQPAPLSAHMPGAPRSLENLILSMLAKDPAARPQSTDVVGARLAAITVAPGGAANPLALPIPGAYPAQAPSSGPPTSGPPSYGSPSSGPPSYGSPAYGPSSFDATAAVPFSPASAAAGQPSAGYPAAQPGPTPWPVSAPPVPVSGPPPAYQTPGTQRAMSQPPMNQPPMNQPPMSQPPMNQPPADQPPLHLPVSGAPTGQPQYQPPQYGPPAGYAPQPGNTPNMPQQTPPGIAPPSGPPAGPVAYGYDGRPLAGGVPTGLPQPKRRTGLIVAIVGVVVLLVAGAAVAIGPLHLLSKKTAGGGTHPVVTASHTGPSPSPLGSPSSSAGVVGGGAAPCGLKIAYLGTEHSAFTIRDVAEYTGMQLALAQYNATAKCPVTAARFDTNPHNIPAPNTAPARSAAENLVADKSVVGVIGPATSTDAITTMGILNNAGVPEISPSATNDALATSGYDVFHRGIGTRGTLDNTIASYVASIADAKVYMVDDGSPYGKSLSAAVVTATSSSMVGKEQVAAEDRQTDFSSTVSRILTKNATVVVYGGYSDNAGHLLKQLRGAGSTAQFVMGDLSDQPAFATIAGTVASSATSICMCGVPSLADDSFTTAYTAMFGEKPPLYSDVAYDTTNMMLAGLKSGAGTRKALLKYLGSNTYQGLANSYKFNGDGTLATPDVVAFLYAVGGATQQQLTVTPSN